MSPKRALFLQVVTRTGLVIALAYVLLNLGIALNKNYVTNFTIRSLKTSITELEQRIAFLHSKLIYLQSNAYRELEVKRRLGMKRIGEQAVLVPSNVEPKQTAADAPAPSLSVDQVVTPAPTSFFERASTNALTWVHWIRGN